MFSDYYRNLKYSDAFLKISVNGGYGVFPIHKVILASHSSFFDDLFTKSVSYATELHYGRRLPTFTLNFEERHAYFLSSIIEWIYCKRVPRLDNDTVWDCLDLLNILTIPTLESIVFQYVEQRVTQFREHFSLKKWNVYIRNTALKRPNFVRQVLKTYFIDHNASDAMEKYEALKDIIKSESLDLNVSYLLMDVIPFQDMSMMEIRHIIEDNLAPQAVSYLEKMDETFSKKQDSGIDVNGKGQDEIEELRNQLLMSSIAKKPTEILSLASEEDSPMIETTESRHARNVRLSTSQILKAASEKLLEIADTQHESNKPIETNLMDPNNSLVEDDRNVIILDDEPLDKKTGFGFMKFKNSKNVNHNSNSRIPNSRRPISFLLDRRPSMAPRLKETIPNLQFVPPVHNHTSTDFTNKRNRSQSNIPLNNSSNHIADSDMDQTRRNRSYSTNPNSMENHVPVDLKSTYSMYNLGDPESVILPDEESSAKRIGIMDLIKGFF